MIRKVMVSARCLLIIIFIFAGVLASKAEVVASDIIKSASNEPTMSQLAAGMSIFNANCRVCHANGGNLINPNMPLRGSVKLSDFDSFLSFIRDPRLPNGARGAMPIFSKAQISDEEARELYGYLTAKEGLDLVRAGSGGYYCPDCGQYTTPGMGPGMMGRGMMGGGMRGGAMMGGGYGMGPGMMHGYGGYGMGPGMMGPGYSQQNEACQKFFDETAGPRKELYNKRYEYFEATRNPKSTPESVANLGKEIRELQGKIYSKAPQGCWQQ